MALLERLADGATVAEAARSAGLTTSAARRRLAALRSEWDRTNNLALIVEAIRRGVL